MRHRVAPPHQQQCPLLFAQSCISSPLQTARASYMCVLLQQAQTRQVCGMPYTSPEHARIRSHSPGSFSTNSSRASESMQQLSCARTACVSESASLAAVAESPAPSGKHGGAHGTHAPATAQYARMSHPGSVPPQSAHLPLHPQLCLRLLQLWVVQLAAGLQPGDLSGRSLVSCMETCCSAVATAVMVDSIYRGGGEVLQHCSSFLLACGERDMVLAWMCIVSCACSQCCFTCHVRAAKQAPVCAGDGAP